MFCACRTYKYSFACIRRVKHWQASAWTVCRPKDKKKCVRFLGKIATGGLLIDHAVFVKLLAKSPDYKDIIGGEMEAWGLYQAVEGTAFQSNWIVVKGICDWGFGKGDDWQPLAAAAAADLAYFVFSAADVFPNMVRIC